VVLSLGGDATDGRLGAVVRGAAGQHQDGRAAAPAASRIIWAAPDRAGYHFGAAGAAAVARPGKHHLPAATRRGVAGGARGLIGVAGMYQRRGLVLCQVCARTKTP
jgi:hypothetical protein